MNKQKFPYTLNDASNSKLLICKHLLDITVFNPCFKGGGKD